MLKRILIILAIAVLLVVCIGCSTETITPEKVEPGSNDDGNDNGGATTDTYAIGETIKMGDLEFTLHSAQLSAGEEFWKPEEGNVYLLVDCTIQNNSSESEAISSMLMFKVTDDQNYQYNVTVTPDQKGQLDGELGAGRAMRGEVAFEVAAESEYWELIFEPNVFGFGQAIYVINASEIQ